MVYDFLADVYDRLMEDTPFERWAVYVDRLIKQFGLNQCNLLDLGCGTGSLSLLLAQRGYKVTGVDISAEMLTQTEKKFREKGLKIALYKQDIRELLLNERFSTVISTFDTLNYILDIKDLHRVLQNIKRVLKPEGILIFDINSPYKLKETLGENTYTFNSEDLVYIWENCYEAETKLCEMYLTFFSLDEKTGQYHRFEEYHTQRAHEPEEIKLALSQSGFDLLGVFGELVYTKPKQEEQKIFFVARNKDVK